jgi:DNA processing protein
MIPQQVEAQTMLPANAEERTLLDLLDHEARHIDELTRASGLAAQTVAATLTMMELKGMARHVGGMQYALAR